MSTLGIIFSSLHENHLSRMTQDRTLAAIPYACRYRLVDFPLSAMVHAGITDVSVMVNYNFRSLADHIGSGKDWDLARRGGGVTLVSPYRNASGQNAAVYSTHLEALISMRETLANSKADCVVLMDSDYVCNIDLSKVIDSHKKSGKRITLATFPCPRKFQSESRRLMVGMGAGRTDVVLGSQYDAEHPLLSMNLMVIDMEEVRNIIREAQAYNFKSLTANMLIQDSYVRKLNVYHYAGTVFHLNSFEEYYRSNMELVKNAAVRRELLEDDERRILTSVHNSAPVSYRQGACVKSSMIADDCVIEGTVENCVLFRGVHIGKGAVVKNSILFNDTVVGAGATVSCVVADIGAVISDGRVLSGCDTLPVYVDKGRRV